MSTSFNPTTGDSAARALWEELDGASATPPNHSLGSSVRRRLRVAPDPRDSGVKVKTWKDLSRREMSLSAPLPKYEEARHKAEMEREAIEQAKKLAALEQKRQWRDAQREIFVERRRAREALEDHIGIGKARTRFAQRRDVLNVSLPPTGYGEDLYVDDGEEAMHVKNELDAFEARIAPLREAERDLVRTIRH